MPDTNDIISATLASSALSPIGTPLMQAICILLYKHPCGITYTRLTRLLPCATDGLKKPLSHLLARGLATHKRGEPYIITENGKSLVLIQLERIAAQIERHTQSSVTAMQINDTQRAYFPPIQP